MDLFDSSDDHASREVAIEKRRSDKKVHKCPISGCDASFSRPYRLMNHVISYHEGEKPYKCDVDDCDKSYTNQSHLKRHKVVVHSGQEDHTKEVTCGIEGCGIICINKYSLKKHIAIIHKALPFGCHMCQEKFSRKSQLQTHKIEIHNESAPYQCDKCSEAFINQHLYQKHIKRHKTYLCDCEKSFTKWTEYLKHKRTKCTIPKAIHKCIICDKTFNWKQNLSQHCNKIHVAESQNTDFKCPYLDCTHSYKYKKNLNFHIKTSHEKVFQYFQCTKENCQILLKSKKNLKQHLRNCHSDKHLKKKLRRKTRKDKGIARMSKAAELSGMKNKLNNKVMKIVCESESNTPKCKEESTTSKNPIIQSNDVENLFNENSEQLMVFHFPEYNTQTFAKDNPSNKEEVVPVVIIGNA